MLNRLRQMDSVQRSALKCVKYRTYYNRIWYDYTANQTTLSAIRTNGHIQYVYDDFTPRPVRGLLPPKRRLSPKRWLTKRYPREVVPPLKEVQMSKVEFPLTKELVRYERMNATEQIVAEGPNAALVPFSWCINQALKPPNTLSFVQVDSAVYGYLLQRAYSRMSTAEFDFGVTIGEVAETAAFLAKPLAGIVALSKFAFAGFSAIKTHGVKTYGRVAKNVTKRELDRIKRTTFKHPLDSSLRILDESANHWLAYKFGVLPLVDDVAKVMEFKENNIQRLTGLRVARVRGKLTDTTNGELVNDAYFYGQWYLSWMLTARKTDQHHCGLYFRNKVTAPVVNFIENLGFAPWQLPSLAYELIPLSFVVDRFIDIKSFVRGNIGGLTKETFGSFCTRKVTTTYASSVNKICLGAPSMPLTPTNCKDLRSSMTYEQMARAVNQSRPNFPVVNPYWRDQLIADATNLSLIWGRLRTNVGKILEK